MAASTGVPWSAAATSAAAPWPASADLYSAARTNSPHAPCSAAASSAAPRSAAAASTAALCSAEPTNSIAPPCSAAASPAAPCSAAKSTCPAASCGDLPCRVLLRRRPPAHGPELAATVLPISWLSRCVVESTRDKLGVEELILMPGGLFGKKLICEAWRRTKAAPPRCYWKS
ncbi:uncharacterized protein [Lolium perenne]|uniref:uncharacterized protein n=1 Tax=Lolium perenne TaxID=4522 RepID=UPI0021F673D6|nr:oleosin-B6-like [Lolium perenne]